MSVPFQCLRCVLGQSRWLFFRDEFCLECGKAHSCDVWEICKKNSFFCCLVFLRTLVGRFLRVVVDLCLVFSRVCMLNLVFAYVEVSVLHVEVVGCRPSLCV